MLHEEVSRYRLLSGDTSEDTSISRMGGFLDGYETGLAERWISIKERVPPIGRDVLVTKFGEVQLAYRTKNTADGSICWVTHHGAYEREERTNIKAWMPLPEPYKG